MGEDSVHPRRALEAYCRLKAGTLEADWHPLGGHWEVRLTAFGGTDLYAEDHDLDTALATLCLLAFEAMVTNQTHLNNLVGEIDTPARWAYVTEGKLQVRYPTGAAGFFCDEIKRISRDNRVLVVEYQTRGGPPDRWSSGIYATVDDAADAYEQATAAWLGSRRTKAVAPDARAWVDLNGFLHIVSRDGLHSTFEVSGINSLLPAGRGIAVNFGDPAVTSHLDFDTQEQADAALNDARDALDAWEAR